MKLDTLYIVTYPTELSTLPDVICECDAVGLERQFKGGLTGAEIAGMYSTLQEARYAAAVLLTERDEELRQVGLIRSRLRTLHERIEQ